MQTFTIEGTKGIVARICDYGARIMNLYVPDASGKVEDIVLGYDRIEDYYHSNELYFGAAIGRFANRIAGSRIAINGRSYPLTRNHGAHHLHGGKSGFHNVFWEVKHHSESSAELTLFSPDMEDGYPGNLKTRLVYTLTEDNALKVEYFASTDKLTHINLTHHSFFNLSGDFRRSINYHNLQIMADSVTEVDEELIPTGEYLSVEGTPFDFRTAMCIRENLDKYHQQLKFAGGFDHNWVLTKKEPGTAEFAARIEDPLTGRSMRVFTNEPGIQFYGGNFLDGRDRGKNGIPYGHQCAFCLETQHFPDSPNQKNFPGTLLQPGEDFYSVCIYQFNN